MIFELLIKWRYRTHFSHDRSNDDRNVLCFVVVISKMHGVVLMEWSEGRQISLLLRESLLQHRDHVAHRKEMTTRSYAHDKQLIVRCC